MFSSILIWFCLFFPNQNSRWAQTVVKFSYAFSHWLMVLFPLGYCYMARWQGSGLVSSSVIPLLPLCWQTERHWENDSWLLTRSTFCAGRGIKGYVLNDTEKELFPLGAYDGCILKTHTGVGLKCHASQEKEILSPYLESRWTGTFPCICTLYGQCTADSLQFAAVGIVLWWF